jgi:hypothetical protein
MSSRIGIVGSFGAFIATAAASAATSVAVYTPCESTEGIGSFAATVTYSYTSGTTASMTILMENDTALALGGYITAIALKVNSGLSGFAFQSSTNPNFAALVGPVSAPPFGNFDAGVSTGGSWTGGGSPLGGIAAGQTALFSFALTGSSGLLASLDAQSVFGVDDDPLMAVRFRGGAVNDWSDKVTACLPAPGAVSLLALVGACRSRRR